MFVAMKFAKYVEHVILLSVLMAVVLIWNGGIEMRNNNKQVSLTLRALGFRFDSINIHEHWVDTLKKSKIVKRMKEFEGEAVIEFVPNWERFLPATFECELSNLINGIPVHMQVTYIPLFNKIETTFIRLDWMSAMTIDVPTEFIGNDMNEYLSVMSKVLAHKQWVDSQLSVYN